MAPSGLVEGLPHNMAARLNHKHSKKTSRARSALELNIWLSTPRLSGNHGDPPRSAETDTDYPRIQGVLGSHCRRAGGVGSRTAPILGRISVCTKPGCGIAVWRTSEGNTASYLGGLKYIPSWWPWDHGLFGALHEATLE